VPDISVQAAIYTKWGALGKVSRGNGAQLSGRENFIDLADQITQVKRFGQDFGISCRAGLARKKRNNGKSGNKQNLETRNYLGRATRELDSIETRHDNISQKKVSASLPSPQCTTSCPARVNALARN